MNLPFMVSHYAAAMELKEYLLRGVTTVREMAGPGQGLQIAVDKGYIPSPRIYPSGTMITQYSGHMDFRNPNHPNKEMGGTPPLIELMGTGVLANGPEEVRKAARQQLSLGATQIKLAVTGSVTGTKDPIYVAEYTVEEIRAAVEAAEDFGTYVAVHAYNITGIQRALEAGAMSIEHGNLIDEPTMKLLVKKDAFFIPQVWADEIYLKQGLQKAKVVAEGTDKAMKLAIKHGAKVVFGSDLMFDLENRSTVMQEFVARKKWFSSPEIMMQATGNAGELLAMSGARNPYGKLGVIEEGAVADLLIYDSNPLEDVAIVAKPEQHLKLIMKDGKLFRSQIQ
jgi:imidazolonepropionase-like amidohydrolase